MPKTSHTKNFVEQFGAHYFRTCILPQLQCLWSEQRMHYETLFKEWVDYLRIVCGTRVENEDLFLRHTYLASLAKLMVCILFSEGASLETNLIQQVLNGNAFREWGVANFVEEDFFSWLGGHKRGISLARAILKHLSQFSIANMDEDALQNIYQDLLDREERHELQEYYTPGRIARRMALYFLHDAPEKRFLDPACGSGVFLGAAIACKIRYASMSGEYLLRHILSTVVGIEIHPVAVIIAKTNYLLALRSLLRTRQGEVFIPIYMADSLCAPKEAVVDGARAYEMTVDETSLYVPALDDPDTIDQLVEALKHYAVDAAQGTEAKADMLTYLHAMPRASCLLDSGTIPGGLLSIMKQTGQALAKLSENHQGTATIWAFVLKNFYKPALLTRGFDVVVGVSEVPPINLQEW